MVVVFTQLVNLKNVVASDQSQLQITQSQKSQNIVVDADGLGYKMKLVGPTAKSTNMECSDFDFSVIFLRRTTWPSRSTGRGFVFIIGNFN